MGSFVDARGLDVAAGYPGVFGAASAAHIAIHGHTWGRRGEEREGEGVKKPINVRFVKVLVPNTSLWHPFIHRSCLSRTQFLLVYTSQPSASTRHSVHPFTSHVLFIK